MPDLRGRGLEETWPRCTNWQIVSFMRGQTSVCRRWSHPVLLPIRPFAHHVMHHLVVSSSASVESGPCLDGKTTFPANKCVVTVLSIPFSASPASRIQF